MYLIKFFPLQLEAQQGIQNINVWKQTEAGAGAEAMKMKRSRSTLIKSKSSGAGAGAMFMKRKAPVPVLCHFYDGSAALFFRTKNGGFTVRLHRCRS